MIFDHISNIRMYEPLGRRLAAGLKYLTSTDLTTVESGKHPLEGEQLFAIVQEYETKPPAQAFWESHRKYIDIQFVVSGIEKIGVAPLALMQGSIYDSAKDLIKHTGTGNFLTVPAGFFLILWPQDVHMPCISLAGPGRVRKVVVKVSVDRD